jgi:hypothetical protein
MSMISKSGFRFSEKIMLPPRMLKCLEERWSARTLKRIFATVALTLALASPAFAHGGSLGHFGGWHGHPNQRFMGHLMQSEARGHRMRQSLGGDAVYWPGGEYEGYEPEHPPMDRELCSSDRPWCRPPK